MKDIVFKTVPEFPMYEVSKSGIIRNIKTHKELKTRICSSGYIDVGIRCDGKTIRRFIHRLVAMAWLPEYDYNDNNLVVDHIDGSRCNNNLNNLRVITRADNANSFIKICKTDPNLAKLNRRNGVWYIVDVINIPTIRGYYRSFYEAKNELINDPSKGTPYIYFQAFGSNIDPEVICLEDILSC